MDDQSASSHSLMEGIWKGRFIGSAGYEGVLNFDIKLNGKDFQGSYELKLKLRDISQVYQGKMRGNTKGSNVFMSLLSGKDQTAIEFEATLGNAKSYALQVMYGLVHDSPQSKLWGGVWIAWRFEKQ